MVDLEELEKQIVAALNPPQRQAAQAQPKVVESMAPVPPDATPRGRAQVTSSLSPLDGNMLFRGLTNY